MSKNIVNSIESNLFGLYKFLSSANDQIEIKAFDGYEAVISKESFWPNMIFNIQDLENCIENINSNIQEGLVPPFCVMRSLEFYNEKYDYLFDENNFRIITTWKGMSIESNKIQYEFLDKRLIEVSNVKTNEDLDSWVQIVSQELFNGKKINSSLFDEYIDSEKLRINIGKYNGEPVSTCLTYFGDGVAGFYMIATKDKFRHRGFGHFITLHSISEALKLGYKIGILQATRIGENMYKKIGFKSYCDFNIYWKLNV
jgi:hypothetical protein